MEHQIGSEPVKQTFAPTTRQVPGNCGPLSYELFGGDLDIISLTFDPVLNLYELTLEADHENQVQSYHYQVQVGLENYPLAIKTLIDLPANVLAKPNSPPKFMVPLVKEFQLTKLISTTGISLPENTWEYILPLP